jgi:uncharacterized membrane protein (DUF2068 family)
MKCWRGMYAREHGRSSIDILTRSQWLQHSTTQSESYGLVERKVWSVQVLCSSAAVVCIKAHIPKSVRDLPTNVTSTTTAATRSEDLGVIRYQRRLVRKRISVARLLFGATARGRA